MARASIAEEDVISDRTASRLCLTDPWATRSLEGAVAEATSMGVPVMVVIVDDGGNQKAMRRMDGAPLVSIQTAQNNGYASAAIGMPGDDFFAAIEGDAAAVASFGQINR